MEYKFEKSAYKRMKMSSNCTSINIDNANECRIFPFDSYRSIHFSIIEAETCDIHPIASNSESDAINYVFEMMVCS
jgi:hypothetical protein